MKCPKHGIEMVEYGDEPDSIWYCPDCELEKEAEIEAMNEPDEWDDPPIRTYIAFTSDAIEFGVLDDDEDWPTWDDEDDWVNIEDFQ